MLVYDKIIDASCTQILIIKQLGQISIRFCKNNLSTTDSILTDKFFICDRDFHPV